MTDQRIKLETPVGVCDYGPDEMIVRNKMLDAIRRVFKLYGGQEIDTPVFELKEILMKKYGEEDKLIYDLMDGKSALRYDLTVPLTRYLVMNKIEKGKFFRIGKVYRRDTPSMNKGRLREFYQCDFDIIGNYDSMFTDAECISIIARSLKNLGINDFFVLINNRKIIDSIFKTCKVPKNLFNKITSSIDKLDKHEWEYVEKEMLEKGLSQNVIDKLSEYFTNLLQFDFIKKNLKSEGILEIEKLMEYLDFYGLSDHIEFQISLVRGLDYYTGTIFEVVLPNSDVGSIAAGGRYDKLINTFSKMSTPCVGLSLGFERIFLELNKVKDNKLSDILIVTCGKVNPVEKIKLANQLRDANLSTEMFYKKKAKPLDQFQYAEDNKIPLCIIIGQQELDDHVYKVRVTKTREEFDINQDSIVDYCITNINK